MLEKARKGKRLLEQPMHPLTLSWVVLLVRIASIIITRPQLTLTIVHPAIMVTSMISQWMRQCIWLLHPQQMPSHYETTNCLQF